MKKIDEVRRFWNSRPCNIKHSSKKINTKEYFDEVEQRKYFVEPHIPLFAEFEKWKNKNVLEIGCGIGTDSINFARAGANLDIVELSEKSLEITKSRFAVFNLNANFYLGNAEDIANIIPSKKYDLIYSFGVIHHSPNPQKIFEGIKQFCHSDTEIKIMLYAKYSTKFLSLFFKHGINTHKYTEANYGSPVSYTYSFKQLKEVLLKSFDIKYIRKTHIFPFKINEYIKYRYKRKWYYAIMPKFLFKALERFFGWHILIKMKIKDAK